MEPAFGADFGGVRVHTDAEADELSRHLDARAFTVGEDIFFRSGEYDANNSSGRQLLAHELTHVVQQAGAAQTKLKVSAPDDVYEQEADRVAQNVARDLEPAVASKTSAGQQFVQQQTVQRDETPSMANDQTVTGGASGAAGAALTKGKTTDITFTANYQEVPGKGKDRVTPRESDDALWIDPLAVHSNVPKVSKSMVSRGVVAGAGQQEIHTFAVPVTEGDSPVGIGSVTPVMKFANSLNASFDATVDLPAGTKGEVAAEARARKVARTFLEEEMPLLGDVDVLEARTADYLSAHGFSDAKVKISVKKSKTTEVGQGTFYYRVRNNPAILMEIVAQPVGEKKSNFSKTESENKAVEADSERHGQSSVETADVNNVKKETEQHHESSNETVDAEYDEAIVKTIDDLINNVTTVHNNLKSELAQKTVSEFKYHDKDDWESHRVESHFTDYTKNVKGYTESGEKDKKNWAAWLQDGINVVKDITEIPFIADIPKVGKYLRKLKGWGVALDIIDKVAGKFAEKGKVKYIDTKEDTTVHDKGGVDDDTKVKRDHDVTRDDATTTTRNLEESFDSATNTEWKRHMDEITKIKKKYTSVTKKDSAGGSEKTRMDDYSSATRKDSAGGSDRVKESGGSTTTVTVSGTTTWKFTKPQINATVVSGDGEVSDKSFKA